MQTYTITIIHVDGKNKIEKEETITADHFTTDVNNNLVFWQFYHENAESFMDMIHSYNWTRIIKHE